MLVREYKESDLDALRAIHAAQAFDYALPDLRNPLYVTKLVLLDMADGNVAPPFRAASSNGNLASAAVAARHATPQLLEPDDREVRARDARPARTASPSSDRILGAAFLRLTAEAYLLLDPCSGTPRERWQWLLALHEAARRDAWQRGLEDVHAWLPPPIARKFGRRLARLGWRRDDSWTPYCMKLG